MYNTEDVILEFLVPRLLQLKSQQQQQKAQYAPGTCSSAEQRSPTIIVGISGCQGSGKSTVASRLVAKLSSIYNLNVADISLDDFYCTHAEQQRITKANPQNSLLQTRGQPGTHDVQLAKAFFRQFRPKAEDVKDDNHPTTLFWPAFDKSLFDGKGDQVAFEEWKKTDSHPTLDVLIFEGWCIGFQPLGDTEAKKIWSDAQGTEKKLASTRLEDVLLLDDELKKYCDNFMSGSMLDFIIHLDVQSLETVYMWREEQEQKLRQSTGGSGMTKLEVQRFVDGYMPAYEMYLDGLRRGFFSKDINSDYMLYLKLDSRRLVTNRHKLHSARAMASSTLGTLSNSFAKSGSISLPVGRKRKSEDNEENVQDAKGEALNYVRKRENNEDEKVEGKIAGSRT